MEKYLVFGIGAYSKWALETKGTYESIGENTVKWTPNKNINAKRELRILKNTNNIDGYDKA